MKKRIYLLVGALCIIMQLVSSCTNFLEVEEKENNNPFIPFRSRRT